jgi:serpin B
LLNASPGQRVSDRLRKARILMSSTWTIGSGIAAALLIAHAGSAAANEARARALTAAYNASGSDLLKSFAATPGNIVLSPYSIGTAMAMVLAGARGETETEMLAALRHTLTRGEIGDANAATQAILAGYDKAREPKRAARLGIANALMLTRAGAEVVAADYAALLKDKFEAELFRGADLARVNGWVANRTEGKIPKLFDSLDPNSALVLLNAVYFKANWERAFNKTATRQEDFKLSASATVKVAMMHQSGDFAMQARPGFRAIRLPYGARGLSMVIVLPDAVDGAAALAKRLGAKDVAGLLGALGAPDRTDLALPRFKATFKASLAPTFRQLGMTRAFSPDADLSGISGNARVPLAIDQIEHSAVIEVEEQGTEAAAATGVSVTIASVAPPAQAFIVDRPFLFYIADAATGAILFQGRIADPRKG